MSESFAVKVIARMHSDFPAKFGIPRQSGLVNALGGVFSHLADLAIF